MIEMSSQSRSKYHLSENQTILIEIQLSEQLSPESIVEKWNVEFHNRNQPSLQTVYKMKSLMSKGDSIKPKKNSPKIKSVLTEEKLESIKNFIDADPFLTNESISYLVEIQKSTTNDGLHSIGYNHYNDINSLFLLMFQILIFKLLTKI